MLVYQREEFVIETVDRVLHRDIGIATEVEIKVIEEGRHQRSCILRDCLVGAVKERAGMI